MTFARTVAGAALPARKRIRVWARHPDGTWMGEKTLDVQYSWEGQDALKDEGLILDADYDLSVRQVKEGGDAG